MPVRYDVDIKSIMPEGEYLLLFVMTSVFFFFFSLITLIWYPSMGQSPYWDLIGESPGLPLLTI